MNILRSALVLTTLALFATGAAAGVVVEQQESGKSESSTVYIEVGKLRMETTGGNGQHIVIFDQGRQVMWMIDPGKKTYYEMTAQDIQRMQQTMSSAMQQMQAQMAQMPPEQRAMMEKMMQGKMQGMMQAQMQGMAQAAPEITVQATNQTDQVGQYTCEIYNVLADGERTEEMCVAPVGDSLLNASEMQTFRGLAEFFEPLRQSLSQFNVGMPKGSMMPEVDGFPFAGGVTTGSRSPPNGRSSGPSGRRSTPACIACPPG